MYVRKKKPCPICKKPILTISKYCRKCYQLGERNPAYKHGNASSTRVCKLCGNKISTGSKKETCLSCRNKLYNSSGNPNYKSGNFSNLIYSTEEYKNWRQGVRIRDNFTCRLCGNNKRGSVEAHHILPKSVYPSLVYDLNNGITLCKSCHRKTYRKELEFTQIFFELIDSHAVVKFRELLESPEVDNQQPSLCKQEGSETRSEIILPRVRDNSDVEDIVRTMRITFEGIEERNKEFSR